MLLVVQSDEALMTFLIGIPVTGVDDAVGLRPQDGAQVGLLVISQGSDERIRRFLGGCEAALRFGRIGGCRLCDPEPEDHGQN